MFYKMKSKIFLIIFLFSFFIINKIDTFANNDVKVYVNSNILEYEDAKPQIINQRVMVPFRKTAESLGAEVDWNKSTETMTLKKGTLTVVHTIRTNIITVNGSAITFDTPSTIINSRTIMPVRMIAEALNCQVEWDNEKRSVLITISEAFINSVTSDKTNVLDGEKITITVNASENTERIKIVDMSNQNILVESSTYVALPNGSKVFSIPWTFQEGVSSIKTLKVFGGTLLAYNDDLSSTKTLSINLTGNGAPSIVKAEVDSNSVARDEYFKITVYANSATEKVKINTDVVENLTEITNYTLSGATRVFETKIKISNRGERSINIYAGNSNGYTNSYETIKMNVTGVGTSVSNSEKLNADLTIYDVEANRDIVYIDESVGLKIYTSSDIEKVEIQDYDENVLKRINFPDNKDDSNNEYIWSSELKITDSGRNRFYVVAYDNNDRSTRYTLSITGESYSKNDLHIVSITQKDKNVIIGDNVTFSVKTTSPAQYIEVREGDYILQKVTQSTSSSSFKIFEFKLKLTSSNVNNIKVIAYDSKGVPSSQRLNPEYTQNAQPEIYEVNVKNNEVYKNEYIRISVYTNSDVSKVWVEDSNESRVTLSTIYDDVSGQEYVWDLRFPAETAGSRVSYTVYAQSSDKLTDEYSFRIKVIE